MSLTREQNSIHSDANLEKFIAVKNQPQETLTSTQLTLQFNDILSHMKKVIPYYKKQVTLLIQIQNQLESFSREIKKGNNHFDKEDSSFFNILNDTIEHIIQAASQYRGNGFEDTIDTASNIKNINIELLTTLRKQSKKLTELNASINNQIASMNEYVSICETNIAEKKIALIEKINTQFNFIKNNILRLEATYKKIGETQKLLNNKFKFHDTLSLISPTLSDYHLKLQTLQNQHKQSCLRDQSISELSTMIRSQNQLSDTINSIHSTLDQYLIEIKQQHNTESETKTITIDKNQPTEQEEEINIEEESLQIQNDIKTIESTIKSTREINAKIYELDMHFTKLNIYEMPSYHGIEPLKEFSTFKSTLPKSSAVIDAIVGATNKYQTLTNDTDIILKKSKEINIKNSAYNEITKQLLDKKNELLTYKKEIRAHLQQIEAINKKSANQLTIAHSAIKQLPSAITQAVKELEVQYNRMQKDITQDYHNTIDYLKNESSFNETNTKKQITEHRQSIVKIKNEFNTRQNASLSKAKNALDIYSNTIGSIILSWLSSWIPFIKDTKKDELTANVNYIQLNTRLFNEHCNQFENLFNEQNHCLIQTQIRRVKEKQKRSQSHYSANTFISTAYEKLQSISNQAECCYQQYESKRIQNDETKQKALQQQQNLLDKNNRDYLVRKEEANLHLKLAGTLNNIVTNYDLSTSSSPPKEPIKSNVIINNVGSFFKQAIDDASHTVAQAINNTYRM